ncbi:ATP-dependent Clp protease ATP-binding subunit [Pseudonocardiaceae bacterium YIM PH 21723]|nr:ATP-dependent Clp protease ATP-binding subunit [Pseudonocardiaceae bacterium YIM PH 21723]
MSPLNVSLGQLIVQVDEDNAEASALAKVSQAQLRSRSLNELGDQLVGHFVTRAREEGASWSQIGEALGVTKQAAQQRWTDNPFSRYTDRARKAVVDAQKFAGESGHPEIGPEHLLHGLMGITEGLAYQVVVEIAGDKGTTLQATIEQFAGKGDVEHGPGSPVPFSASGKKVLEASVEQALALGHNYIGTEHILLGALAVPDTNAAGLLAAIGVTLENAKPLLETRLAELVAKLQAAKSK